jgi:hypothetical protein
MDLHTSAARTHATMANHIPTTHSIPPTYANHQALTTAPLAMAQSNVPGTYIKIQTAA